VRVAINVEQLLYPSPGGIGRYTRNLLTLLPGLGRDDDVVGFCARHGPAAIDRALADAGVPAGSARALVSVGLPRPLLYDAWHLAGLPPLAISSVRLTDLDVVHAPSVAVPPAGRYGLVVTIHDLAPELYPQAFTKRGRRFHRQGLLAATKRADMVIAPSNTAAEEINRLSRIGPERIRVVPNGVEAVRVGVAELISELDAIGLGAEPYVLWAGSREPRKDVGTLVAAMAELTRQRRYTPRLVLVGYRGWMGQGLINPLDRAALGERLIELGVVAEATLRALYAGAVLFAFPSRHEGFGLPVLEAMAQGTAVVCSDIDALREISGGNARLVPPGEVRLWSEAIAGLLDDERARSALEAAGPPRAAKFSLKEMVEATRRLYREVAG
jgi:glycosyltransferase involved in cell wall biosynthesis